MNYLVILSGGSGTRFWPLSRRNLPKQFLNIYSDKPMIRETIERIKPLIKGGAVHIASNRIHSSQLKKCLKGAGVSLQNVLLEPQSRNTFPPIGVLTQKIYAKDKDAVILVLPSDHFVRDGKKFVAILKKAVAVAKKGYIVTLGIKPDRPETGYGYIHVKPGTTLHNLGAYEVEGFIEKPDAQKAKRLIRDKRYFWNGGIFIFRADTMLAEIKKFLPHDARVIKSIKSTNDLNRQWKRLTATSVDYAIMEKTRKIALVPADCGWMDLGSWETVGDFSRKDGAGNVFRGNCLDLGSKNSFVISPKRLAATVGLENVIIVDTDDALLVCAKNKSQDVKKIVEALKRKKRFLLI